MFLKYNHSQIFVVLIFLLKNEVIGKNYQETYLNNEHLERVATFFWNLIITDKLNLKFIKTIFNNTASKKSLFNVAGNLILSIS